MSETSVAQFLELFHRFGYIYKPLSGSSWYSADERWKLPDSEILKAIACVHPKFFIGCRAGKSTRFDKLFSVAHAGGKPMRWPAFTIVQRGVLLVLLPLLFGVMSLGCLLFLIDQAEKETARETRIKNIGFLSNELASHLVDAMAAMSVYAVGKDESFAERYERVKQQNRQAFQQLLAIVGGEAELADRVKNIEQERTHFFKVLDEVRDAIVTGSFSSFVLRQNEMRGQVHEIVSRYAAEVKGLNDKLHMKSYASSRPWRHRLKVFIICFAGASVALSLLMAVFYSRGITRRLEALKNNAVLLAAGSELQQPLGGKDEIAALDQAFHNMAKTLMQAARREKALVDNAADVICSLDEAASITAVSPACERLLGYRSDELIHVNIFELVAGGAALKASGDLLSQKNFAGELACKHKDGRLVPMLWASRWSDQEHAYFCVGHDISERKAVETRLAESEAEQRTIIESMPIALMQTDDQGVVSGYNKAAEKLLEAAGHDLSGKIVTELLNADGSEQGLDWSGMKEESGILREASLRTKAGAVVPVECGVREITAGDFLFVAVDITERAAMERLKREFVSMAKVGLKKPLDSVRTVLNGLLIGHLQESERASRLVRQSINESERLSKLIDDLLASESLQVGKIRLDIGRYNLREMLAQSVESLAAFASKHNVEIEQDVAEIEVECDRSRLIQVFVNLLSNAIKFSPPSGAICVRARQKDAAVEIEVADKGRGIPADQLQKVFGRFTQVRAEDQRIGGSGLGLAICKAIVEQHGGSIVVTSEEGKGSIFVVRLTSSR